MAKRLQKKPLPKKVAVKSAPTLHRCIAENTVQTTEYSRRFGPGQIVDFEESIGDGLTLGNIVRRGAFEALEGSKTIGKGRKP